MKKLIAAGSLLLAVFSPAAAKAEVPSDCNLMYELGEVIMLNRQIGTSLPDLLRTVRIPGVEKFVIIAYKKTRWQTEAQQKRAIKNFAELMMITCLEANEERG